MCDVGLPTHVEHAADPSASPGVLAASSVGALPESSRAGPSVDADALVDMFAQLRQLSVQVAELQMAVRTVNDRFDHIEERAVFKEMPVSAEISTGSSAKTGHDAEYIELAADTPHTEEVEDSSMEATRPSHLSRKSWQDQTAENSMHAIKGSAWDILLFAGCRALKRTDSVFICICGFLNLVIQGIFIMLVQTSDVFKTDGEALSKIVPPVADVEIWHSLVHESNGLRPWNITEGHSLAARVCAAQSEVTLEMSGSQARLYESFKDYTQPLPQAFLLPAGPLLCFASCLVWTMVCLGEYRESNACNEAITSVPDGDETVMVMDGGRVSLRSLSCKRRTFWSVVQTFRSMFVCGLCVSGLQWLAITTSVEELLLNTAALGFIMDVDELIYTVVAPRSVQLLVDQMDPLLIKPWHYRWYDSWMCCCRPYHFLTENPWMVLMILLLGGCGPLNMVVVQVQHMQEFMAALCPDAVPNR